MKDGLYFEQKIFDPNVNFDDIALQLFDFQRNNNPYYKKYIEYLGIKKIENIYQIPYLPVEFFKKFDIKTGQYQAETVFKSSGTTGINTSRHFVKKAELYYQSLLKGFGEFYGDIRNYRILALLPAYLERTGSSLVTMAEKLMEKSQNGDDGFFLYDFDSLKIQIENSLSKNKKVILIGVTFALLDFAEKYQCNYGDNLIIMETGGMKGRRKEIVREEVHKIIKNAFGVSNVHSEYGMTELLSQAYSNHNGIYRETSTMKILIRETTDPLNYVSNNTTGGVNIIDLANIYSCSFLETKDLGIKYNDNTFSIIGRFDNSDIRGCNLLYDN